MKGKERSSHSHRKSHRFWWLL